MPTTFLPPGAARHPDAGGVKHRELMLDATDEPLRYAPIAVHAFRLGRKPRANVCITSGAFSLDLRPDVAELRALALMFSATADEMEISAARPAAQAGAA